MHGLLEQVSKVINFAIPFECKNLLESFSDIKGDTLLNIHFPK